MKRLPLVALAAAAMAACDCGGGSSQPAPLQIVTSALPDGQVGVAYSASLAASGGAAPYLWAVTSGTLPAGLSLSSDGSISGTPTVAGSSSFAVTVTDSAAPAATASATLSIAIQPATGTLLRITTTSLADGTVSTAYGAQLASSGGTAPVSWALGAGTLPPGLVLSASGAISGTPTVAGSYSFTVVAVDSSNPQQSASAALSVQIAQASGTLAVTTANLPQGTVGTAYSQQLAASGGTTPYSWSVAAGALPAGLTLSVDGLISGTPTTAGSFTFTVQVTDGSTTPQAAQATFGVTINPNPSQAIAITTGALPSGTVGLSYQAQLQASGGTTPYAWAVVAGALPNGLSLSASGSITGTPTAAGTFTFTVEVQDSSTTPQAATKQFTITIAPKLGQSLAISTANLPSATEGTAYSATVAASGGTQPYTFTLVAGALPDGLSLSASGSITGTPMTSGTFSFTVRVTDSSSPTPATADRALSITVSPAQGQLAVTTQMLQPGRTGVSYGATLAASNGTPPYTWAVTAGALPPGLQLSSAGVISGTPTAAGTFTFTVRVTDSLADTASKQLSIVIR